MQLGPAEFIEETQSVRVTVPPTRSDILHAVDIIEGQREGWGQPFLTTLKIKFRFV